MTTGVTKPPKLIFTEIERQVWNNGDDTDTLTGQKRVVGRRDKIKARDINELRANVEMLLSHTHNFEYLVLISGGSTTTTCG